jgi:hypothetical protein
MQQRAGVFIKFTIFAVALGFALSGRPPAHAQAAPTMLQGYTQVPSNEDIKEDGDIAYMKASIDAHTKALEKLTDMQVEQGKDAARSDTKMTCFCGFIAFMQAGGMLAPMFFRWKAAA